jgi:hypothetical protein
VGFSPLGLIVSVGVLAPNLLLVWFPPRTPLPSVSVPGLARWLERAGQALCMAVPAITAPGPVVWWWLLPAASGLACYYILWGRYLATGREPAALYRPWHGVPIPMAILPVIVFVAAAAWLNDIWIAVAALVLAAGHIPAVVLTARAVCAGR